MTIEDLKKFIKIEAKRLEKRFGKTEDKEKLILSSTVKIIEEFGELAELVLKNRQRKEKNIDNGTTALEDEFADSIITISMLAHDMGIDIEKALKNKIKKIDERYK